jgi:phenylacetyl-CoA:acceptor oxidoreductase subunit 1
MTKKLNRRDFIKLALTSGGTVAVLKGLKATPALAKDTRKTAKPGEYSWAMVIDQAKCNGCGYCIEACRASNDVNPDITWTKLYEQEPIGNKEIFLSVPCMHCGHAPCVSVCPVGASYYRDDGIVMMDYDLCIGCRYCQVACPYDARSFNWEKFKGENPSVPEYGEPDVERRPRGVVEKCTFCAQKIDRGIANGLIPGVDHAATPACVSACPQGARIFGNLNDPHSNVSIALSKSPHYQLREELGTHPRVYYLPANRDLTEEF